MFDKLKARLGNDNPGGSSAQASLAAPSSAVTPPPSLSPPSQTAIYRYRTLRSLNLGSLFVLEAWITPSPFSGSKNGGQADLDIALGKGGKEAFEKHWDGWTPKEEDWKWMVEKGFNTVRLPIGWYHLPSTFLLQSSSGGKEDIPSLVSHTDFIKPLKEGVWDSAWSRIEDVVKEAGKYGIGVLIDLHAAPGGQNADAHCGMTSPKPPHLLESKKNGRLTIEVLKFLAGEFRDVPNVVGLELLNEPANHPRLEGWYKEAIREVGQVGGEGFPLYIHDAWIPEHFASASTLASLSPSPVFPLAIDHHLYRCFTSADTSTPGSTHTQTLQPDESFAKTFQSWSDAVEGALIVGEFSAALGEGSLPQGKAASDPGGADQVKREWLRAQLGLFDGIGRGGPGAAAGWCFWSWKKEQGWDNGWSAQNAMQSEVFPAYVGKRARQNIESGDGGKENKIKGAYDSHVSYWTSTSPHQTFEHDRFLSGLQLGWTDAAAFIHSSEGRGTGSQGVNTLGFWGWTMKRRREEHLRERPRGKKDMIWEFEHGYKEGVKMANAALVE